MNLGSLARVVTTLVPAAIMHRLGCLLRDQEWRQAIRKRRRLAPKTTRTRKAGNAIALTGRMGLPSHFQRIGVTLPADSVSQLSGIRNVDGDFSNLLVRKETMHAKLQVLRDLRKELGRDVKESSRDSTSNL